MKFYEMLDRWGEISEDVIEEAAGVDINMGTPFAIYVSDYASDDALPLNAISGPVAEYVMRMVHKWGVPEDLAFALGKVGC